MWQGLTAAVGFRGGMVFTFLAARGLSVGTSLVEADKLEVACQMEVLVRPYHPPLVIPSEANAQLLSVVH